MSPRRREAVAWKKKERSTANKVKLNSAQALLWQPGEQGEVARKFGLELDFLTAIKNI